MLDPSERVEYHTYHHLPFNIFFILPFFIGCFAILKPDSTALSTSLISWSFIFGLIDTELKNHPSGKLAKLIKKW